MDAVWVILRQQGDPYKPHVRVRDQDQYFGGGGRDVAGEVASSA